MNATLAGRVQDAADSRGAEELKGFSRTTAEIEWLLVILVLLY